MTAPLRLDRARAERVIFAALKEQPELRVQLVRGLGGATSWRLRAELDADGDVVLRAMGPRGPLATLWVGHRSAVERRAGR
jgi:hypothetical protein